MFKKNLFLAPNLLLNNRRMFRDKREHELLGKRSIGKFF